MKGEDFTVNVLELQVLDLNATALLTRYARTYYYYCTSTTVKCEGT